MTEINSDTSFLAVERAMMELRAGRPVWVDDALIAAAELHPQLESTALDTATKLLILAQLLPQAVLWPESQREGDWLRVTSAQVAQYPRILAESLTEVAEAALPLKVSENVRIKVFRPRLGLTEHLAVIFGNPQAVAAPLVRVHSSCITGDLLGSLRCDCGDQLHLALERMAQEGAGVLCYLNQEGRGIGLGNKIRAYALQEQGQDTRQANESLGFAGDERDYRIASVMLKKLGISQIRLLTNNPTKLGALEELGIEVLERVPLQAAPQPHNQSYLDAKVTKFGHWL